MFLSRFHWYFLCLCAITGAHALAVVGESQDALTSAVITTPTPIANAAAPREVRGELTRRSERSTVGKTTGKKSTGKKTKGKKGGGGVQRPPTPDDQVIKITLTEKQNTPPGAARAVLDKKEGDVTLWSCDHAVTGQVLSVDLEFSKSTESLEAGSHFATKGDTIGYIQTLDRSTRVATYEGGGTLTVRPRGALPMLDAYPSSKPFYDTALQVPSSGDTEPVLRDGPSVPIPSYADKGDKEMPLQSVHVEEHFTVRLYNMNRQVTLKQWTWGYSYTLTFKGETYTVTSDTRGRAAAVTPVTPLPAAVLSGPIVGELMDRVWTNGYSTKYRWPEAHSKRGNSTTNEAVRVGGGRQKRWARK